MRFRKEAEGKCLYMPQNPLAIVVNSQYNTSEQAEESWLAGKHKSILEHVLREKNFFIFIICIYFFYSGGGGEWFEGSFVDI
jgi:hypothetical protein